MLVAGTGSYVYATRGASAPKYQLATATLGTVTQTLSLAGNLTPTDSTSVDFVSSGRVATVGVQPGDTVQPGQLLAKLDSAALDDAMTQAQANLQSAQAKLSLDQQGPTQQNLASAQSAVSSGQVGLSNAQSSYNDAQSVNQQSVSAAQATLSSAQNLTTPDQNTVAADQSRVANDQSSINANCPGGTPPSSSCQQAQQQLAGDTQHVAADQQALAKDEQSATSAASALSAAQVHAQQSNDQARAQVATANVQLQNAQNQLVALQNGTTSQQITMDQSQVSIAQVSVNTAQRNLAGATLTAPVAGLVAQVNVTVGAAAGSSSGASSSPSSTTSASASSGTSPSASAGSTNHAVVLLTPGAFQVVGTVSDAQANQIATGQRARITPAGATQAIDGHVTAVSPEATVTAGVATFSVTVTLDGNHPALHAGTSATISVVVNQVVQVVTLPTAAVHGNGSGATVQLMVNGSPQSRPVIVGASDSTRTEIQSGVSVGDTVVLATISSTVPSNSNNSGGGGLIPGGGGGGRARGGG